MKQNFKSTTIEYPA